MNGGLLADLSLDLRTEPEGGVGAAAEQPSVSSRRRERVVDPREFADIPAHRSTSEIGQRRVGRYQTGEGSMNRASNNERSHGTARSLPRSRRIAT